MKPLLGLGYYFHFEGQIIRRAFIRIDLVYSIARHMPSGTCSYLVVLCPV